MTVRSCRAWLFTGACLIALGLSPVSAQDAEPATEQQAVPWDGATDVTLPPFLRDTDRRVADERPGPTEAQLEALRQLEAEVARFSETGETFRSTVNSLVRRQYLQPRRERA